METIKKRIEDVIHQQKDFFNSGTTRDIEMRLTQLKRLKEMIQNNIRQICEALYLDLHKSMQESEMTEVYIALSEIDYHIKHLKRWAKGKLVLPVPFTMPGKSKIIYEPYGITLIIAPWNYPFQLLISPLIGSISAGNCAILKPSPLSKNTSELLSHLISEYFPERYIAIFEGDTDVNQLLLNEKYDYIFFTGGPLFGQFVAQNAAKNLTPCTLELGGKSPCIVSQSANLALAAKRIVWGKLLNAGQTCIAPDYLFVEKSCKNELIQLLKKEIVRQFHINPQLCSYYPKIIHQQAVKRLELLIKSDGEIIFGGDVDVENCYVSPTLILEPSKQSAIMNEEIFGPILPIFAYDQIDEVIKYINDHPKPLSLYYFGSKKEASYVINHTSSGSVCINDTVIQIANRHLPFGGVGKSGMGRYHGKMSFLTFSNSRSIHWGSTLFDFKMRYAPYKIPNFLKRFI